MSHIQINDNEIYVENADETKVVLHHTIKDDDKVRVKLSKMSKGYQWEISTEAPTVTDAMILLGNADRELRDKFGEPVE